MTEEERTVEEDEVGHKALEVKVVAGEVGAPQLHSQDVKGHFFAVAGVRRSFSRIIQHHSQLAVPLQAAHVRAVRHYLHALKE